MHIEGLTAIVFCRIHCVLHDLLQLKIAGFVAYCRIYCDCILQDLLQLHFSGFIAFCTTCCNCTLQDSLHIASFLVCGRICITCGCTHAVLFQQCPPPGALTGLSFLPPQICTQRCRRLPRAGDAGREALRGARDAERQVALQRVPLAPGRRH